AGQARPVFTAEDMKTLTEIREKLAQFQKRMANPVIGETVTLKITLAPDAEPGQRELRLGAPNSLSQPLVFCVGQLPEFNKPEAPLALQPPTVNRAGNPNAQAAPPPVEPRLVLPCVVNGQILPGGVDRYRFEASKGQKLVIAVAARELMPYLADAVPGWFQAAVSLYDAQGHEVAFADHYRFHPDPVLYYEVPRDGEYVLQIRDSIYRGREDFVYRITAGEVPYVTGLFPLGGPAGAQTTVQVTGWNLPVATVTQDDRNLAPGTYPLCVRTETNVSNHLPFAVDTLPEIFSREGNHSQSTAQLVTLPVIVNGRIAKPGQWDVFRFQGRAGDEVVAETIARRLDSPLDSVLRLTDAAGKQLAFNDDFEDKGAGLQTQYADSWLTAKLPANGAYYLYVGDAQHQGGPEYAYRLRLSPPRPDFDLRVTPSSVTVRGGMAVPLTVYALRHDGFSNEITLALKGAPPGFALSGSAVPANENQVRVTLTGPPETNDIPVNLTVEGFARIQDQSVIHAAVPADNMMQAFAYWHLVPSKELDVTLFSRGQFRLPLKILGPDLVQIPVGGTAGFRMRVPGVQFTNNFELQLSDPPDGLTIEGVSAVGTEAQITLHTDAAKIKPGVRGNLIVNILAKRAPQPARAGAPARANQQRPVLGVLPAIPFEVVSPELLAK
ncbi:MAG: peptidase, partial [Verrucomicrobiota bacterium]